MGCFLELESDLRKRSNEELLKNIEGWREEASWITKDNRTMFDRDLLIALRENTTVALKILRERNGQGI